jgi:hypothetical protein
MLPGSFLYLNSYRILCTSNLDDIYCVPPGLVSLPDMKASRPSAVRDGTEQAKLLCQSDFREPSRNFTYLCWVLPGILLYKIRIWMFFIIPCIALYIVGR